MRCLQNENLFRFRIRLVEGCALGLPPPTNGDHKGYWLIVLRPLCVPIIPLVPRGGLTKVVPLALHYDLAGLCKVAAELHQKPVTWVQGIGPTTIEASIESNIIRISGYGVELGEHILGCCCGT